MGAAGRDFKQDLYFKTSPHQCLSPTRRGYCFSEELLESWAEPPGVALAGAMDSAYSRGQEAGGDTGEPLNAYLCSGNSSKTEGVDSHVEHPLPGPGGTLQKAPALSPGQAPPLLSDHGSAPTRLCFAPNITTY